MTTAPLKYCPMASESSEGDGVGVALGGDTGACQGTNIFTFALLANFPKAAAEMSSRSL